MPTVQLLGCSDVGVWLPDSVPLGTWPAATLLSTHTGLLCPLLSTHTRLMRPPPQLLGCARACAHAHQVPASTHVPAAPSHPFPPQICQELRPPLGPQRAGATALGVGAGVGAPARTHTGPCWEGWGPPPRLPGAGAGGRHSAVGPWPSGHVVRPCLEATSVRSMWRYSVARSGSRLADTRPSAGPGAAG